MLLQQRRRMRFGSLVVLLIVVLSACGSTPAAQEPTAAPTTPPAPTAALEPTAAPTPTEVSQAVTSLDDVRQAVVQIEAEGTFVSPSEGTVYNAAGRGSGFIIDESGIAVTNNHVVTGAALLKVYVGGDRH
jgi:serine protease Do